MTQSIASMLNRKREESRLAKLGAIRRSEEQELAKIKAKELKLALLDKKMQAEAQKNYISVKDNILELLPTIDRICSKFVSKYKNVGHIMELDDFRQEFILMLLNVSLAPKPTIYQTLYGACGNFCNHYIAQYSRFKDSLALDSEGGQDIASLIISARTNSIVRAINSKVYAEATPHG